MKVSLQVAAALCVLLAVVPAARAQTGSVTASTTLSGKQDVPPTNDPATGTCSVTINKGTGSYTTTVTNIKNLVFIHVHVGNLLTIDKASAPVLILFSATPALTVQGTKTVTGPITSSSLMGELNGKQLNDLVNLFATGQLYCDMHVTPLVDGKAPSHIRGQFPAQPQSAVPPSG